MREKQRRQSGRKETRRYVAGSRKKRVRASPTGIALALN